MDSFWSRCGKIAGLFALVSLLTACVSVQPSSQPAVNQQLSWQQRVARLTSIQRWTVKGALGIRTPKGGGSSHVYWRQQGHFYTMDFSGPLGAGSVKLTGQPGKIILAKSKQKKYSAATPEQLIQQQLGWKLPVTSLYYWIRGIPVPGVRARKTLDRYGHLKQLYQQGWQVQFQRYTAVRRIDLPSKLTLSNPPFRIKIVINEWQLR